MDFHPAAADGIHSKYVKQLYKSIWENLTLLGAEWFPGLRSGTLTELRYSKGKFQFKFSDGSDDEKEFCEEAFFKSIFSRPDVSQI